MIIEGAFDGLAKALPEGRGGRSEFKDLSRDFVGLFTS